MKALLAASTALALLAAGPALANQAGASATSAPATSASATGASATGASATGANAGMNQQNATAAGFVQKAGVSNLFEIESSQVALDKAQSQQVRDFAQQMVQDHQQAGQKLKSTLADAQLQVMPPQQLDQEHANKVEELQSLQGSAFDRTYVQMQTQAHEKAIALFSFYAENGDNADLQQFASNLLPTLQQHYEMIRSIGQNTQS